MGKRLKQCFSKEGMGLVDKHRKRCSASLATEEIYIKVTIHLHYTCIRMAKIEKLVTPNAEEDVESALSLIQLLLGMWNGIATLVKFGSFLKDMFTLQPSSHNPVYLPWEMKIMYTQKSVH